jgi:hypothetical protein
MQDNTAFNRVMGMLTHWRELRGRAALADFKLIQVVVLTAQVTSLLAGVLVAFSKDWPEWARLFVALLAAFPAFCLSLERAFNFALRHRLNGEAHYKFQTLILDLANGADPEKVEREFIEYQLDFEKRFPSGSVSAFATSDSAATRRDTSTTDQRQAPTSTSISPTHNS